jgi:2-keto-3-deoxy-L-rhamnonate aldolase RhmA
MSIVPDHAEVQRSFRARLEDGAPLLGTFLKTASGHPTEILAGADFDFVVVDAEHAPFSRADLDMLMMAARAGGIASVVRVASASAADLLTVLDCGAAGVLVPHVASAADLETVVARCRYAGGRRGFSNSPRAGGYGALGFTDHMAAADANTSIIAMIEDPEALDRLDEIFAVSGLTAAFIGRGDLAARFGAASVRDGRIDAAVDRIGAAARQHGIPLIAHVGSVADADMAMLRAAGVSAFLVASDQGLLRQAALAARRLFSDAANETP